MLARDLRQEVMPHFASLFTAVVSLINPADPEALEAVFTCLSFLFKYLAKLLIADLPNTFA